MATGLQIENLSRTIDPFNATEAQSRSSAELGAGQSAGASSFGEMLEKAVEKTNELQAQSDQAIHELVAGKAKNVHETMLTIERADMSLKLMMQVRNKVLDAYREIMRMQV